MAELTVPFWLASSTFEASASVGDWMRTVRVNPRWLDEIVVISTSDTLRFQGIEGCPDSTIIYRWVGWHRSEHLLLHNACREVIIGDRRLILLLSESKTTTTAVLLSAPAMVGIYNLNPLAYVDAHFSTSLHDVEVNLLETLAPLLAKIEKKPSQVDTLLISPGPCKRPVKTQTEFAGATWTKPQPEAEGALAACHEVLNTLIPSKHKNGLALEVEPHLDMYATWIEKI